VISRGSSSSHAAPVMAKLKEKNVEVHVCQADIADMGALTEVLNHALSSMPALAGVFHLAGVLDDGTLLNQTPAKLENAMRAKAHGAWHLHLLTRQKPLDYFVLFSSIASVFGSPGQGNYAAANAFLDALAEYRRGRALPALAVNWGPFENAGMAAEYGSNRRRASGIGSLSVKQGMAILADSLRAAHETRIVAAPLDLERLLLRFERGQSPPLLRELTAASPNSVNAASRPAGAEFVPSWRCASADLRHGLMVGFLREQVAAVMGLSSSRQLDSRQGFTSLGIDSLMAVELKARLQTALGLSLPNTIAFEHPNIEALAGFLSAELIPDGRLNGNGAGGSKAIPPDSMESLSEDEIAALLADKLEVLSSSTNY